MTPQIAIVGAAESDHGILPGSTALQLHAQGAVRALKDSGLSRDAIDGVFSTGGAYGMMPLIGVVEYLGLDPKYVDSTNTGGAAWEFLVEHALGAINAGLCEVALLTYGALPRSDTSGAGGPGTSKDGPGVQFSAPGTPAAFEDPFGMPLPARGGLVASRHQHLYGTTSEQMAAVSVATRRNAGLNPTAMYRDPITIEDVLASPLVADPLHRLDCCVVTDGGGSVILTTMERARDLKSEPIAVLGTGGTISSETLAGWEDLPTYAAAQSGKRAYRARRHRTRRRRHAPAVRRVLDQRDHADRGPGVLRARRGRSLRRRREARLRRCAADQHRRRRTFVEPPGMRGMFLLIEAVRQLRGRAGEAQVRDAEVALCNGTGGPYSSCGTVILGKAS